MPSRFLIVVIVLFWLGSMGWLVRREVWPRLAPGEPPLLRPDYLATSQPIRFPIRWEATVSVPGQADALKCTVITTVRHRPADDTVDLESSFEPRPIGTAPFAAFELKKVTSRYRVDFHGRLRQFHANAVFTNPKLGEQDCEFLGEVKDGVCTLNWERHSKIKPGRGTLQVEVSHGGQILLPLHPVTRLPGVTAGRRWGMYLLDPLDRAGLNEEPRLRWIHAEVRSDRQPLQWSQRERSCLVIDYRSEDSDVSGSVWLDPDLGNLVLYQEVRLGDETWKITRKDSPQ
jgi:hypothetical protein